MSHLAYRMRILEDQTQHEPIGSWYYHRQPVLSPKDKSLVPLLPPTDVGGKRKKARTSVTNSNYS